MRAPHSHPCAIREQVEFFTPRKSVEQRSPSATATRFLRIPAVPGGWAVLEAVRRTSARKPTNRSSDAYVETSYRSPRHLWVCRRQPKHAVAGNAARYSWPGTRRMDPALRVWTFRCPPTKSRFARGGHRGGIDPGTSLGCEIHPGCGQASWKRQLCLASHHH